MVDYDLMGDQQRCSWWRTSTLIVLYILTTAIVFLTWNTAYDETQLYPPRSNFVPNWWLQRASSYANSVRDNSEISHDFRLVKNQSSTNKPQYAITNSLTPTQHLNKLTKNNRTPNNGNNINNNNINNNNNNNKNNVKNNNNSKQTTSGTTSQQKQRLVCYYSAPETNSVRLIELKLADVNATLCTHINIGLAEVHNSTIVMTKSLERTLSDDVHSLLSQNPLLKLLLWIGGGGSGHEFSIMIKNHTTRKIFIQSLKQMLQKYHLNGVDLDFEFPSAYNKERMHFSQLLYEIRQEFRRENHLDYLLSVAVGAPEGIALFAYDVPELNKYADYVNLMTYDFHFYTEATPFTGLNAPLKARLDERGILATLNINYSVNWWLSHGMERNKLVVGLPTYGHSFVLVNPFNNRIGAPASGIGQCGNKGFTTYSEICWFYKHNPIVLSFYDLESCSPFLSSGTEWISFEDEMSLDCKANYIKSQKLGGAMLFSLNTDDFKNTCNFNRKRNKKMNATFPLIETVRHILFA